MDITYELASAPNYSLMIVLGIGEKKFDDSGDICGVPSWYLFPADRPESKGIRFSSKNELEGILNRLVPEFFDSIAKPLWEDEAELAQVISKFKSEDSL